MRRSDLRSHCSLAYSADIQRYQFSSTMPWSVSKNTPFEYHVFLMSLGLLSNPATWSIYYYASNNSNATPPFQGQALDVLSYPYPFLTSAVHSIISEIITRLSPFCLALTCSTALFSLRNVIGINWSLHILQTMSSKISNAWELNVLKPSGRLL